MAIPVGNAPLCPPLDRVLAVLDLAPMPSAVVVARVFPAAGFVADFGHGLEKETKS